MNKKYFFLLIYFPFTTIPHKFITKKTKPTTHLSQYHKHPNEYFHFHLHPLDWHLVAFKTSVCSIIWREGQKAIGFTLGSLSSAHCYKLRLLTALWISCLSFTSFASIRPPLSLNLLHTLKRGYYVFCKRIISKFGFLLGCMFYDTSGVL